MGKLLRRLTVLLRWRQFVAELGEELRLHEQMKREELQTAGVGPSDLRAAAHRALGPAALAHGSITRRLAVARG